MLQLCGSGAGRRRARLQLVALSPTGRTGGLFTSTLIDLCLYAGGCGGHALTA